jgi:hypothetical protein
MDGSFQKKMLPTRNGEFLPYSKHDFPKTTLMGGDLRDDPGDRVKKGFTRVNKWKNCDETQERSVRFPDDKLIILYVFVC